MKLLSTKRYEELLEAELKVKQAGNEVQRKEFCIQRKQKLINTIEKKLKKLSNKSKKEEYQKTFKDIQEEINK